MKKLLSIALLGLMTTATTLPYVPTQPICSADPIHTIEPIDENKLNIIRPLFSTLESFFYLYDKGQYDEKYMLNLINSYRQSQQETTVDILDKEVFVEFLKYSKNLIAQEIIDMVKEEYRHTSMGDTVIEDYACLVGIGGTITLFLSIIPQKVHSLSASENEFLFSRLQLINLVGGIYIRGLMQGMVLCIGAYGLYHLIPYYRNIRSKEKQMRNIDAIISKIETMKE